MLFVIYLAWMSPTYCNSRQNVFDAYAKSVETRIVDRKKGLRNIEILERGHKKV
jgi:hypothetical protein